MDPELKRLLEQNLALTKENHQMLRAMRRRQWLGFSLKMLVWAALIVAPFYFYQEYFVPLVAKFAPQSGTTTNTNFFGIPSGAELQKLIEQYQAR